MKSIGKISFLVLFLVLVLSSCNQRTNSVESIQFKDYSMDSGDFIYFRVEISDPNEKNDIYFSARFSHRYILQHLPLEIVYISPSGKRYSDITDLPLIGKDKYIEFNKQGVWRDYRWLHKRGVVFPEKGVWMIRVSNTHIKRVNGIKELGLTMRKS